MKRKRREKWELKVKKLITCTGDEYTDIVLKSAVVEVPKEFYSMLEFNLGDKKILINTEFIETIEINKE